MSRNVGFYWITIETPGDKNHLARWCEDERWRLWDGRWCTDAIVLHVSEEIHPPHTVS